MYTDSPVALWGDRALRYGYRKQLCELTAALFESYAARTSDGQQLLKAEINAHGAWQTASTLSGLDRVLALISQPLLGHVGGDQFALSYLERDYATIGEAVLAPSSVRMRWSATLTTALASGELDVPALGRRAPWGAFSARNVATRVTYPEHLLLAEL
jgi:hypothetical protein